MKRTHIFEAKDGRTFLTAAECKAYEEEQTLFVVLSDLNAAQIASALVRADVDLADAFERAGNIIAKRRRESGDLRRAPKADAATIGDVAKAMAKNAKT